MPKKVSSALLSLLLAVTYQSASWAGQVLERIKQTGTITAGTRTNAIPFSYVNQQGKWVGYSIDILELIRQQAEKELGRPLKLKLVEITPQNRFAKIKDHSIDIECSSTTFTWQREKEVDFSVSCWSKKGVVWEAWNPWQANALGSFLKLLTKLRSELSSRKRH
jgi:polar amino acid transport system substrate-binding protein